VSNGITRLTSAKYGVFWRRRDDWHSDALRRFVTIVAHGVPRFLLAFFRFGVVVATIGIARSALVFNFVSNVIPKFMYAKYGGIATIDVAVLVVGLPASCLVSSRVFS
jgi:hypothetical protein